MNKTVSRGVVVVTIILALVWFGLPHQWWQNVLAVPVFFIIPGTVLALWGARWPSRAASEDESQEAMRVGGFLDAVRATAPGLADSPDSGLLDDGRQVCAMYAKDGDKGVVNLLTGIYADQGAKQGDATSALSIAALSYLCPAPLAAVSAVVRAVADAAADFHDDLVWRMIAECQRFDNGQVSNRDELVRLASTASEPMLLAGLLAALAGSLTQNPAADMQAALREREAARDNPELRAAANPEQLGVLEFHRDLAWQMIAEAQRIHHGQMPDPGEFDRLASKATLPVFLAEVLAMIAASLTGDTAANMQPKATAARLELPSGLAGPEKGAEPSPVT